MNEFEQGRLWGLSTIHSNGIDYLKKIVGNPVDQFDKGALEAIKLFEKDAVKFFFITFKEENYPKMKKIINKKYDVLDKERFRKFNTDFIILKVVKKSGDLK